MYGRTFGNVIDSLRERFPQELALVDGDLRLTFAEAVDQIRSIGAAIRALGLGPGDSVGIAMKDTADLVLTMHACLWAGVRTVPLNMKLSVDDHRYMLGDAGVSLLLFHGLTAEHVSTVVRDIELDEVRTVGDAVPGYEALSLSSGSGLQAPTDVDPAGEAWVQYTGGTTGLPKGVIHSHETLLTTLLSCALEFDFQPGERHAHVCPLTHSGVAAMMPVWLRGGCNYLLRGFDVAQFLDAVQRERITSTIVVPTMLVVLLESPDLAAADISSLRTVVYGAAPITPATLTRALNALGPILVQSYGQTEVFAQISLLDKAAHVQALKDPTLLTAAGRPVAIAEVRIGDENCSSVPTGDMGEILVRGPHRFLEYLNKPQETAEALAGGWLHTGDIGRIDERGYLFITDRKKDMIISGGFNVFPREIEDVVASHPAVRQCCVVGVPDDKWGERVTAVVVSVDGTDATVLSEEIRSLVRERKGPVYAPKSVVFVDRIPETSVGKFDKKALVSFLLARDSQAPMIGA
jgi:fatty-acyl-CoA synthase